MKDLALYTKALMFAAQKHSTQKRKNAEQSPYINHPISVADILANEAGVDDVDVLAAALLHDTIEDTDTTEKELEEHFGKKITSIVLEASDDKSLGKAVRKQLQIEHAATSSPEAKFVKMADKIANLRDMLISPPADWNIERKYAYFDWAKEVVSSLRGNQNNKDKEKASAYLKLDRLFDEVYACRHELSKRAPELYMHKVLSLSPQ